VLGELLLGHAEGLHVTGSSQEHEAAGRWSMRGSMGTVTRLMAKPRTSNRNRASRL
jgi:hypothetical protein